MSAIDTLDEKTLSGNDLTVKCADNGPPKRILTHLDLTEEHIADLRLLATLLEPVKRRELMATVATKYCQKSPRLTEEIFGWGRGAVRTGLGELSTGIKCIGLQGINSGTKRWEDEHPFDAALLCKLADDHSQQDPTFNSTLAYTRLTAKSAWVALVEAGVPAQESPSPRNMSVILNRLGYRLRPVQKAKAIKKIDETDAIFENVKKRPSSQRSK